MAFGSASSGAPQLHTESRNPIHMNIDPLQDYIPLKVMILTVYVSWGAASSRDWSDKHPRSGSLLLLPVTEAASTVSWLVHLDTFECDEM